MSASIKIKDIVIPDSFKETQPKEYKLDAVREYVRVNGKLDRPVILKGDTLVNNYTRYLVALEFGMEEVPCFQWNVSDDEIEMPCTYIVGKFKYSQKPYVWRVRKGMELEVGDVVLVRSMSKNGKTRAVATVVEVFTSDDKDLLKHKTVIKKLQKKADE